MLDGISFRNNKNMKIKRLNLLVAKIYFEDDQGNPIQIPSSVRLWDATNNVGVQRDRTTQSFIYLGYVITK